MARELTIALPEARYLNPSQNAALACRSPALLVAGGFGSGKTTTIAMKAIQLKAMNPNVPGLIVAPTRSSLWSTVVRRLLTILALSMPRHLLPVVRDRSEECYLDWGDGVPVYLRSATRPDLIDGIDAGWGVGDELRYWPRRSYEVFLARVRVPCALSQSAFASTPAVGYMAEEFNTGKEGRTLITAPTRENIRNLEPGYIQNLHRSYSARLIRAVVEGIFTPLEGGVFENFDPMTNGSPWIVDYDPKSHRDRKTILAVDPGFQRSAWMWIHEITPTKWIVFDQIMPENTSDAECVRMVNERGWKIDEIWTDPAADATQSALNLDTIAMMQVIECRGQAPIRYITLPQHRSISYGVDKLRVLLGDPYMEHQPLRLGFSRALARAEAGQARGIVKDLASIRYPDVMGGKAITDKPYKDHLTDHSTDALRYFGVGMWLTSPLREIDTQLRNDKRPGYRVAA